MSVILNILFILFIFILLVKAGINKKIYTVEDYKRDNPKCIKNERILCNACGSNHIHIRVHSEILTKITNKHICVQCGKILYYSKEY